MPSSSRNSIKNRAQKSKSPRSRVGKTESRVTNGSQSPKAKRSNQSQESVTHFGGCHCGAVRFSVKASAHLHVFECNCSVCYKKQNHPFIVPKSSFTLLKGSDSLTTYTFLTGTAQHTFCKVCGVQSFYTPRSNPDGYGIMPHCVDEGTIKSLTRTVFDGLEWEKAMQNDPTIPEYSAEPAEKRTRF